MTTLLRLDLRTEQDIVLTRQRMRDAAQELGFDALEQTRLATAVSEVARNAIRHARGGTVELSLSGVPPVLTVLVRDEGPGIRDVERVLEGRSPGLGIVSARKLVDRFEVETTPGKGTTVLLAKDVPAPIAPGDAARIAGRLRERAPANPLEEVQRQNQELARTLAEVQAQRAELAKLNKELEDTNRGVVALFVELEEKADSVHRAQELRTKFFSHVSHEFRTPLNSILALVRLLLERTDGELTAEQEKQVAFIRRSAEDLSQLVNDLLDLAKVEAGKATVRPSDFDVVQTFSALRGMLRPLLGAGAPVALHFEDPAENWVLHTDEGKVSQVLRNFLSNAIKFTEQGEIRVACTRDPSADAVTFSVRDTGVGIAPEDQERIFQEFGQLDTPVHRRVKGTGLGLPLSCRLAELLGGRVTVESAPGRGSTFRLTIPRRFPGAPAEPALTDRPLAPDRAPVLCLVDDVETLRAYDRHLDGSGFQAAGARTLEEARHWLRRTRPAAVLLAGAHESAWAFLAELAADPLLREVPVLVAGQEGARDRARAHGAAAFATEPVTRDWLLARLRELPRPRTALVVDADEVSRYLLRAALAELGWNATEEARPERAAERMDAEAPAVVFVDLPTVEAVEWVEALRARSPGVPVVVHTARVLAPHETRHLASLEVPVVPKGAARDELRRAFEAALARGKREERA